MKLSSLLIWKYNDLDLDYLHGWGLMVENSFILEPVAAPANGHEKNIDYTQLIVLELVDSLRHEVFHRTSKQEGKCLQPRRFRPADNVGQFKGEFRGIPIDDLKFRIQALGEGGHLEFVKHGFNFLLVTSGK
jgi:hypothetical protein